MSLTEVKTYCKLRTEMKVDPAIVYQELIKLEKFRNLDEKYITDLCLAYNGSEYEGTKTWGDLPYELQENILTRIPAFELKSVTKNENIWRKMFFRDFNRAPKDVNNSFYLYWVEFWKFINVITTKKMFKNLTKKIKTYLSDEDKHMRYRVYNDSFFMWVRKINTEQKTEIKKMILDFFYPTSAKYKTYFVEMQFILEDFVFSEIKKRGHINKLY